MTQAAPPDHARNAGTKNVAEDWRERSAPGLDDLEVLAFEEFARLPAAFRSLCSDVVFRVEDFPEDDVLRDLRIDDPFGLLGLFQGIGLPFQSTDDVARMPNMVWLYRRPILDYWAAHDETLGALVRHVLIHEIGHHFGLSDRDMEAIEARAGD